MLVISLGGKPVNNVLSCVNAAPLYNSSLVTSTHIIVLGMIVKFASRSEPPSPWFIFDLLINTSCFPELLLSCLILQPVNLLSAGVVHQKVLGIIPSSTAGGTQTYTTFQPRTTTLNIRPSTPGSQQQVQLPRPSLFLPMRIHRGAFISSVYDMFSIHHFLLKPSQLRKGLWNHTFLIETGSGSWWSDPSNGSDPDPDSTDGAHGKDDTPNTSYGPTR